MSVFEGRRGRHALSSSTLAVELKLNEEASR